MYDIQGLLELDRGGEKLLPKSCAGPGTVHLL